MFQGMLQQQVAPLANAAQIQQQLMQLPEQQAWESLANYLAMVQGNYGGTGKSQTPYYTNPVGSALGGGLGGAALGSMFGPVGMAAGGLLGGLGGFLSDRSRKEGFMPIDTSAIADGVRRLPVERWRYKDDQREHIGTYAGDFREIFDLGDGSFIPTSDAFGVLFATVQHLMAQNDELRSRIEELEDAI
jgi:hypothetical protein